MSNHSTKGASGANRWFNCPGSVALIAKAPKQESSKYASQGTAAHSVLEECFPSGKDPWDYLGAEVNVGGDEFHTMENEDIEAVVEAIELIKEEMEDGDYEVLSEVRVELKLLHPDLFGTADIILVDKSLKKLKVIDYKHGAGVPVEVMYKGKDGERGNLQLMYYGLGGINYVSTHMAGGILDALGWEESFDEVHIGVIQPRCYHSEGAKRMWRVPNNKLQEYADTLKEKAEATEAKDAPLSAGTWCRWCPAAAMCPQFGSHVNELAKVDFKKVSDPRNLNLPEGTMMSSEEIAKLISFEPIITDWLKQIKAHGQRMLERGEEVPGHKLVKRKTHRKWADEDDASDSLLQYLEPHEMTKLLSPAQVEKVLSKKDRAIVKDLTVKPEGGLTMVPEHDKREAVRCSAANDFEKIEKGK